MFWCISTKQCEDGRCALTVFVTVQLLGDTLLREVIHLVTVPAFPISVISHRTKQTNKTVFGNRLTDGVLVFVCMGAVVSAANLLYQKTMKCALQAVHMPVNDVSFCNLNFRIAFFAEC